MQFQVPQFIEIEDKIFGPLTLKQFLYLAGGGAAVFLLYISLPFFFFILAAAPVGGFAAALAFLKINNRPFINLVENALRHFSRAKIYVWKKTEKPVAREKINPEQNQSPQSPLNQTPAVSKKRLSDLAWSLDIKKDGIEQR
ncbi:MAG: PrgI family protein [Candidatus Pacebacteria bacterium]|nr:PrgI family protein [Candidatus Paceibacterota bacterium]